MRARQIGQRSTVSEHQTRTSARRIQQTTTDEEARSRPLVNRNRGTGWAGSRASTRKRIRRRSDHSSHATRGCRPLPRIAMKPCARVRRLARLQRPRVSARRHRTPRHVPRVGCDHRRHTSRRAGELASHICSAEREEYGAVDTEKASHVSAEQSSGVSPSVVILAHNILRAPRTSSRAGNPPKSRCRHNRTSGAHACGESYSSPGDKGRLVAPKEQALPKSFRVLYSIEMDHLKSILLRKLEVE